MSVPEDVSIYIATAKGDDEIVIKKMAGKVIPANTGVLLYSENAETKELTYYDGEVTDDFSGNLLKATGAKNVVAEDNCYALVKGEEAIAKVDAGVEIPANKAYFTLEGAGAKLALNFDATTAIETAVAEENASEAVYNTAGQRVDSSYKGIVVKNGKKYIQK